MPRTVSVRLEAQVAEYIRNLSSADKATGSLEDKIKETGLSSGLAGEAVDGLGNDFRDTGRDARKLKNEIEQVEHSLAALALEYAAASSVIDRSRISDDMTKRRSELQQLVSVDKLLPKPGEVEAAGSKIGKRLGSSISDNLELVKSGPALAAIGVAAAPVIGATISAAVIGGAGVGGVIGGVLLAARDPRVKAAGAQLGNSLLGDLQQDAAPFVAPLLASIGKVEARFDLMGGRISQIFSESSHFLSPLVNGVLDGVDGITRGIGSLIHNAGPVIDSLGQSFSIVGNSVGHALTTISGDSEDAASALTTLARATGGLIEASGYLVRGLTEVYGVVSFLPSKISDASKAFGDFVGVGDRAHQSITGTATAAAGAVIGLNSIGSAASAAVRPVKDLDKAQADAAASSRSLYSATTDTAGAIAAASKTIGANGKALSLNTAKGRENRAALSEVADAMNRQHQAAVGANGENAKSARISATNAASFQRLAEKAGYSAGEARHLARSLGLIKTRYETRITAETAQAEARAKRVRQLLNGIHGRTVSVNVLIHESQVNKVNNTLDRLGARATGGPVKKGSAYVVGEHRPEVFVPDRDGTIIPSISEYAAAGPSMMVAPSWQVSGSSGGTQLTVVLENHGVIGSRAEVDDWLTGSIDRLRSRGRV
jgi:hypothetical protein